MDFILDDPAWDLKISEFLKFSDVILWFCLPPLFPSFLFSNFAKSSQLRSYWLRLFSPAATPAKDRIKLNKVFFGEKNKNRSPRILPSTFFFSCRPFLPFFPFSSQTNWFHAFNIFLLPLLLSPFLFQTIVVSQTFITLMSWNSMR